VSKYKLRVLTPDLDLDLDLDIDLDPRATVHPWSHGISKSPIPRYT